MHRRESRSGSNIRLPKSKEEELERKRALWREQQLYMAKHQERLQKMCREYEERRARELGLKPESQKSSRRSRSHSSSRSRSKSREQKHHSSSASRSGACQDVSEKCSTILPDGLFKGSEGTKFCPSVLKKIKVDIIRKIDTKKKTSKIQRDILQPEDVTLLRRDGEGAKPIFEREEIKKGDGKTNNGEERRITVSLDNEKSASDSRPIRRSFMSPVPKRHHSRSPLGRSRHESSSRRHEEKSSRHRDYEREHHSRSSRERDERYEKHRSTHRSSRERSDNHRSHRSNSRDRENRHRSSSDYRSHRDRREHSRDDSRDRRVPATPHYIETMPVPFFYPNFGRPMMIDPMMTMRAPFPMGRPRMPPMIAPFRAPFLPRGYVPAMSRPHMPPHHRYGPTF